MGQIYKAMDMLSDQTVSIKMPFGDILNHPILSARSWRDDLRSDIYSLGMVFYELLTGQLPFERSTHLAKVRMRLKADPVPPRHYNPDIAPQIQEIILKSLLQYL